MASYFALAATFPKINVLEKILSKLDLDFVKSIHIYVCMYVYIFPPCVSFQELWQFCYWLNL